MRQNIMRKIMLGIALAVAFAVPAQAQSLTAESADNVDATMSEKLLGNAPPPRLPDVSYLREYGERFEKAIRLIEAEAAKPGWGWDDDCGHWDQYNDQSLNW
jgi:hypothetical protein